MTPPRTTMPMVTTTIMTTITIMTMVPAMRRRGITATPIPRSR